jgi:hypothetical protein
LVQGINGLRKMTAVHDDDPVLSFRHRILTRGARGRRDLGSQMRPCSRRVLAICRLCRGRFTLTT